MKKVYLFALIALVTFSSCVMICWETSRTKKYAAEHSEFIAVTAADLHRMLVEDTTCYKICVFWSPCCGPCISHMGSTYPKVMKQYDKKEVKWFFVLRDTGGIKSAKKTLRSYGFDNEFYYLADTNAAFSFDNEQSLNNLTNYLFPEGEKVNDAFGIPLNYIVDKKGHLLKSYNKYPSETRVIARDLYDVKDTDIRSLDFSQMDTVTLDFKPIVCTSKGCY